MNAKEDRQILRHYERFRASAAAQTLYMHSLAFLWKGDQVGRTRDQNQRRQTQFRKFLSWLRQSNTYDLDFDLVISTLLSMSLSILRDRKSVEFSRFEIRRVGPVASARLQKRQEVTAVARLGAKAKTKQTSSKRRIAKRCAKVCMGRHEMSARVRNHAICSENQLPTICEFG